MEYFEAKNLGVKYIYGALAVDNVSFCAKRGETLFVYGGGEAGKTSLLKCIAGLEPAFAGEISLNGKSIEKMSTKDRNICLIQEDGGFFEGKTTEYNLRYPLKVRGVSEENATELIGNAIFKTDLDENILGKKVKKLSPTERVKLTFARALTRQADLYLIDDPLKILGIVERKEIFPLLKSLVEEFATRSCAIYATDLAEELSENSDVVFLNYGICIQRGKVGEIKKLPQTLTAARVFAEDLKEEITELKKDEAGIFVDFDGKRYNIDGETLMSEIFIGENVVALTTADGLKLYDEKSERLIYYDNGNQTK